MYFRTQRGFTLTEFMIAVGISSIMVGGMYQTFVQQQRLSTQQEQVTEARQNARLSMEAMTEEIREAGFDPGGLTLLNEDPPAGIKEADATHIRFTRDLNCNGWLGRSTPTVIQSVPPVSVTDSRSEDVAYRLNTTTHEISRTGYIDGAGPSQPVASNIIELKFCYVLSTSASGPCTSIPLESDLPNITAVQVTLTATASAADATYRDTNRNYSAQYQHYRKATLTSVIRLRNLGINRGQGPQDPPMAVDFREACVLPHQ
jgi:type IV pilus assembly protein PilW